MLAGEYLDQFIEKFLENVHNFHYENLLSDLEKEFKQ
jgi:hypothetical protein